MSLLPLFNLIEKEANKNPNLQKKLKQVAEEIEINEQAEHRNKELSNFYHQQLMEYYTLEMIAEQYAEERDLIMNVERAAHGAYESFLKLCEQIKRFDFQKVVGYDVKAQQIQMQQDVNELEVYHEREVNLVEKMKNRKILQTLRQQQDKNTEALNELTRIKRQIQKTKFIEQQKVESIKMQHNLKIVNLVRSLKEMDRLRNELLAYQTNEGNESALTKQKNYLIQKYEELKNIPSSLLSDSNMNKTVLTTNNLIFFPLQPFNYLTNINEEIFKRPTLKDFYANYQAKKQFNMKDRNAALIKPILRTPNEEQITESQTKQVHFLLPVSSPSSTSDKSCDDTKIVNTNQFENDRTKVIDLLTPSDETCNDIAKTHSENETAGVDSQGFQPKTEAVHQKSNEKVEILECIILPSTNKFNNYENVASNPNNNDSTNDEVTFKLPSSTNRTNQQNFLDSFMKCSTEVISDSSETIEVPPQQQQNHGKQKRSQTKLKKQQDFEKFFLMNVPDGADDSDSQQGNPPGNRYLESDDLFFDDLKMTDDIDDDNKLFDLSDGEIATIANNNFF